MDVVKSPARTFASVSASMHEQRLAENVLPLLPPGIKQKEIIIVGAGLAGTAAAYNLYRSGLMPQVYEASKRCGGRVHSERFRQHILERGGEMINHDHRSIQELTRRFGLKLQNLYSAEQKGMQLGFLIDGQHISNSEFVASLEKLRWLMETDIDRCGGLEGAIASIKSISLEDYVNSSEISDVAKAALFLLFQGEYGLPIKDISAAALFYEEIHELRPETPEIFHRGYGQYKIEEGCGSLVNEMTERIDSLYFEHRLTKVAYDNGRYALTFDVNGTSVIKHADIVVLAVPNTALRDVDFSECQLSAARLQCIDEMKYAQCTKTFVEGDFKGNDRHESATLDSGLSADVWNTVRNSSSASRLKTIYASSFNPVLSDEAILEKLNRDHEPGHKAVIGRQEWNTALAGGCYSIDNDHLPTEGRGIVEHQGRLFFAGEHVMSKPSYMDSAVRSGIAAAYRILRSLFKDLGAKKS